MVLASFFAALCVTLLAPFVHPVTYELVCSAKGSRLVATTDPAAADERGAQHDAHEDHAAHCPLCMPVAAPPTVVAWDFTPVQPLAHALQAIPAARLAGLVGAPLPARGPPVLS